MRLGRKRGDADDTESTSDEMPETSAPDHGPWDVDAVADDVVRIDFGSLLVPAVDGMQLRVDLDEAGMVTAVAVTINDTSLQLQAFAAPRSEGLWDEVRTELVAAIADDGGAAVLGDGPLGPEVTAEIPVPDPDDSTLTRQPVRFIGADGPRWFLRGVVTGRGVHDAAAAETVLALWRDVVVRRGTDPLPPRELLPLQVPQDPALSAEPPGGS